MRIRSSKMMMFVERKMAMKSEMVDRDLIEVQTRAERQRSNSMLRKRMGDSGSTTRMLMRTLKIDSS